MIKIPRVARKYLNTSFFHVIVQGINKEYIFNKKIYIEKYLDLLNKYSKELKINIIAYCIMNNHAHFLLEIRDKEKMSKLMQKVNSIFARYYNEEEKRVGYVFKDRFLSQPIFSEKHLSQCIRYIHLNPVKAHMVEKCEDYEYSSYKKFISQNKEFYNREELSEDNNKEYKFLDIDSEINIEEGIESFLIKNSISVIDVFTNRKVLKELIKYLKENININYTEIMKFLDITKGTMERLK